MAFEVKQKVKFPRNEHVDILVRRGVLNGSDIESHQVEAVEIREVLRDGDIAGHGIVLPLTSIKDLRVALDQVTG